MPTLYDCRIAESGRSSARKSQRIIAVAVRDHTHDAATLDWAASEAIPGVDALHIVHTYVPLHPDACRWDPVTRARDARYLAGRQVTAQAVQRVRAARTGLAVDGSTVAGLPADVLAEFSKVVDLIVIGDDSAGPVGARGVSRRVQDVARCAVVAVPPEYRRPDEPLPVTVVVSDFALPETALCFGIAAAARRQVTVQVSRTWESLHEGEGPDRTWLAHQQEEFDAQLADWRLRFPHLPIVARIELDDGWPTRLASHSCMVVTEAGSLGPIRRIQGVCPVVTVPERTVPERRWPRSALPREDSARSGHRE